MNLFIRLESFHFCWGQASFEKLQSKVQEACFHFKIVSFGEMPSLLGNCFLFNMSDVYRFAYVSVPWQGHEPKLWIQSFGCLLGPHWLIHWHYVALGVFLLSTEQVVAGKPICVLSRIRISWALLLDPCWSQVLLVPQISSTHCVS